MVNPLASVFDWFIQFMSTVIPAPAYSFLFLALTLFVICSLFRWL